MQISFMQREQALAELVASHVGIDLFRFSGSTIDALLQHVAPLTGLHDAATLRTLATSLAIGETAFLRRPAHFTALSQLLSTLPENGGAPRIWSAGCSTGEEAYSLAAVLPGAKIFATDVREDAIAQARLGRYRLRSLRGLDPHGLSWLDTRGDRLEVRPELRQRVEFRVHNLVHDPYPEGFDVIFCRNVLLYFRAEVAAAVLARLIDSLHPGGVLFLGDFDPTPTMPPHEQLCEESLDETTFFRREIPRPLQ